MCLSLLGTWSGRDSECWNPQTSTILQARGRRIKFPTTDVLVCSTQPRLGSIIRSWQVCMFLTRLHESHICG